MGVIHFGHVILYDFTIDESFANAVIGYVLGGHLPVTMDSHADLVRFGLPTKPGNDPGGVSI